MSFLKNIAAAINPKDIGINDPITNTNLLMGTVLSTVYFWAGVICVIVIVVAGYFYTISAGNATHTKRAKDAITGAIIGIIVILLAFTITQFVIGRF